MATVPDVSAMLRTYYNEATLAACVESLLPHPEITDICICTNEPIDGPAHSLVPTFKDPRISFYYYPNHLLSYAAAAAAPLDHPGTTWNYYNWCMRKCKNDQILKVDGDQVLIHDGARLLFEKARTQDFLGLTCWELTSPTSRTKDFTGEEPRYWNRNLGVKFYKFPGQGFEYIWNPHWGTDTFKGWGPSFRSLGSNVPVFLHYGWLTSTDPVRPHRNLEQVPYTGSHSPLVDLSRAFGKCTDVHSAKQPITEDLLKTIVKDLQQQ